MIRNGVNEELAYLAAEAMDRGTSYGKLVASITPAERAEIIGKRRAMAERRSRAVEARRRRLAKNGKAKKGG